MGNFIGITGASEKEPEEWHDIENGDIVTIYEKPKTPEAIDVKTVNTEAIDSEKVPVGISIDPSLIVDETDNEKDNKKEKKKAADEAKYKALTERIIDVLRRLRVDNDPNYSDDNNNNNENENSNKGKGSRPLTTITMDCFTFPASDIPLKPDEVYLTLIMISDEYRCRYALREYRIKFELPSMRFSMRLELKPDVPHVITHFHELESFQMMIDSDSDTGITLKYNPTSLHGVQVILATRKGLNINENGYYDEILPVHQKIYPISLFQIIECEDVALKQIRIAPINFADKPIKTFSEKCFTIRSNVYCDIIIRGVIHVENPGNSDKLARLGFRPL